MSLSPIRPVYPEGVYRVHSLIKGASDVEEHEGISCNQA